MSWQFAAHKHVHNAVQAQADIKAVHAQGTIKTAQAQADIIAITKRVGTVAKRLTRNAPGSTYWKKAAIEQAQLLDKMLDVAKASENDQLIAAVQKCHDAWGDGNPHYRAALDSGMTITECLAMVLAGKQPDQNVPGDSLNHPVTTANSVNEPPAIESSANREQVALVQKHTEPSIEKAAFWKTLGRNLILPVIGCGAIAVVCAIAAHKTISDTPVIGSATPRPEQPAAMPTSKTLAATPTPQIPTPTPPPVQTTPTPSQHEKVIDGKAVRKKHPTHG